MISSADVVPFALFAQFFLTRCEPPENHRPAHLSPRSLMKLVPRSFATVSFAFFACVGASTLRADLVEMIRSTGDFNAPASWSDRAAPSSEKDYINDGAYHLRTPDGKNARFPGRSLTIVGNGQNKGARYATLMLKLNSNGVLSVDDLRLQNAVILQGKAGISMVTIEGGVTLLDGAASSVLMNAGVTLNLAATVTGPGGLRAGGAGGVVLLQANDYAGGTWVDAGMLRAQVAHSLGTGNVFVADEAVLELSSGQAMALGASLLLAPRSTVTLSFSGTLSIARLSLDGGATFVRAGVWGGTQSGADNRSNLLNGIGLLRVRGSASGS